MPSSLAIFPSPLMAHPPSLCVKCEMVSNMVLGLPPLHFCTSLEILSNSVVLNTIFAWRATLLTSRLTWPAIGSTSSHTCFSPLSPNVISLNLLLPCSSFSQYLSAESSQLQLWRQENKDENSSYLLRLLQRLNESILVKNLEECLAYI